METGNEIIESKLSARRYLYTVFQLLIGNAPSAEQFEAIDRNLVSEAYSILDISAPEEFITAMEASPEKLEELKIEYTKCFEGPGEPAAPLWESVFINKEAVLFQPSTLEVRDAYRAVGLIPELYPTVADDHIALELDFLRELANRVCTAYALNEISTVQEMLSVSRKFLHDHLLLWIDTFASDMVKAGVSDFYSALAQAAAEFVTYDNLLIEQYAEKSLSLN